jgi:formylglycine-generating enzyme required for sulfatase activity
MKTRSRFLTLSALGALALAAAPVLHSQTPDATVTESEAPPAQGPEPSGLPGFAFIPGGEFVMGDSLDRDSKAPWHPVNLSAFHIQTTEVSKEEWDEVRAWALLHEYPDLARGSGAGRAVFSEEGDYPVQTVTWFDVVKWCNAKSEMEELTPCYYLDAAQRTVYRAGLKDLDASMVKWSATGYRLPTEAEWEKAARGGLRGKRFPWGNKISHSWANFQNAGNEPYQTGSTGYHPDYSAAEVPYTSPVGTSTPNEYGLYDVIGNVCEWCWDRYGSYPSWALPDPPQTDPRGAVAGASRVIRGGCWYSHAYYCRVAHRYAYGDPSRSSYNVGFRLARSLAP